MRITQDEIIPVFDEGKDRLYEYDGNRYPSVTSIIGSVLDKPALTPWAYRVGIEGAIKAIQQEAAAHTKLANLQDYLGSLNYQTLNGDITAYGYDIESKKKEGGSRGLVVHEWAEARAKAELLPDVADEYKPYIESLEAWFEDYQPLFLESEYMVVHTGYGYAGTFDGIVEIGNHPPRKRHDNLVGKRVLLDFKTNTEGRVYAEQHLPQVEAYAEAYASMGGTPVDECIVVGIGPKKDGKPKYQTIVSYATFEIFHPILDYYKQRAIVKESNPNRRKK